MGISGLMGLKATLYLLTFIYHKKSGFTLLSTAFLYASFVEYLIAFVSLPIMNRPLFLGKSSDGSFPLLALIIFSPFLLFIRIYVFLRILKRREPLYNEVCEGLYVGGWPDSLDGMPPGEPAVIDCTCELPRSPAISKNPYMCIPTWDTRAPRPSEIESAVRWACRNRAHNKPIFIHCAFGHGRSVSVMCALLVALDVAEDWKDAEKIIRIKRPTIRMNVLHRKNLEEWSNSRLSSGRKNDSSASSIPTSSASLIQ